MKDQRFGSSTLIAGVLLVVTACGYGSGTIPDTRRALDIEGAVHLNVTNRFNGPMEIYAAGRGTSYRIGTVLPGLTGHFIVRPTMVVNGPVEFFARAGNRNPEVRSGQFLLVPGNVVDFELAATLALSVATVRP